MQVFASRQIATTLKSLSADKMLFRPHKTTGWRSAMTTLTQRDTEDSAQETPQPWAVFLWNLARVNHLQDCNFLTAQNCA
jgi:hypothetical protein